MSTDANRQANSEAWSLLRAGGRESTGLELPTLPTGVKTPAGAARLALGEHGEPRLLLPLGHRDATPHSEAPSLRILVSTYVTDGKPLRYLDLTCVVPELEAVFSELVAEVLARLESGQSSVAAALSTVEDFRRLLLQSRTVPTTRIAGLLGELLVLGRLLDRAPGAWRTWRGPLGDRHDFRSGDHALEVKTSARVSANKITVSSMEQMAPPAGGSLHLLHIVLEETVAGQLSISTLARAVMSRAHEPNRIRDCLAALGCDDFDSPQWNATSFRLEAQTYYLVGDHFPRLTPNMLRQGVVPAGVSDVTYQIDLATAVESRCNEAEARAFETTLSTCISTD